MFGPAVGLPSLSGCVPAAGGDVGHIPHERMVASQDHLMSFFSIWRIAIQMQTVKKTTR